MTGTIPPAAGGNPVPHPPSQPPGKPAHERHYRSAGPPHYRASQCRNPTTARRQTGRRTYYQQAT